MLSIVILFVMICLVLKILTVTSDRVRYNLFSEASIVSDSDSTNSADSEIENENVVESSSCESTESAQQSARVMPRFNGFDLSKFRCSEAIVDKSNCVVKDSTVVKIINKLSVCSRNVSVTGNVLKANSVLVLDGLDETCNVHGEHLNQVKQSTPEQRVLTADNCDVHNFSMYLRQCEADERLFDFFGADDDGSRGLVK